MQGNLANSYDAQGRLEESVKITREIYALRSEHNGKNHVDTLLSAVNLASTLVNKLEQYDEARSFLRARIPEAIRALGKDHDITFKLQRMHAQCLYKHADASLEDVTTAIATLEDLDQRMGRIYGNVNPQARWTRKLLEEARETLARAK